jgi:cellulose synthase/poly-beta-1,6-N-acetylglucosamine synthase-like glycosyltransferase
MSLYASDGVLAVVPACNEEDGLWSALESLLTQTRVPTYIIVVVNNSTDRTLEVAQSFANNGVLAINLPNNEHLKAGALNAGIEYFLAPDDRLPSNISYVLTMDGDTTLDPHFVENAIKTMRSNFRLGGVSASCLGKRGLGKGARQRTLTMFQEIEYARHRFARFRRNVHTMSGAGSFYRSVALQRLLDAQGKVFREDSKNLVEDFQTTLELKQSGWSVTSNEHCVAHTDLMLTLPALLKQRQRWVRGTVDELRRRGWNRHTRDSILTLILGLLGVVAMAAWMTFSAWKASRSLEPDWSWALWSGLWPLYQAWAVRSLGWRAVLIELLILPELCFGVLRVYWLARSVFMSYTTPVQAWE